MNCKYSILLKEERCLTCRTVLEKGREAYVYGDGEAYFCNEGACFEEANRGEGPDPFFGLCPRCGGCDGYLNIHRAHWFCCNRCKTKWIRGSNLFSCWRYETEDDWKDNFEKLKDYDEVEADYGPYDENSCPTGSTS